MSHAEQSVIGSGLMDSASLDRISLVPEDFKVHAHATIYRAMISMVSRNEPVDVVTVAEKLEAIGELENCGGLGYLADLVTATPSSANIGHYAKSVRQDSVRRAVAAAANEIAEMANGKTDDVGSILEFAQQRIMAIGERATTREPSKVMDIARDRINVLETMYGGNDDGLSTGLVDLDERLGKIRPGDVVVIAGRPGMGKSAFAMQLAESLSTCSGKPALVFSLEMSAGQLVDRIMSNAGRVNLKKFRTASFDDHDWSGLAAAVGHVHEMPLWIDDHSNTLQQMLSVMRQFKRKNGLGVVVIDYLQLVTADADSREQEVAKISRSLKLAAKSLGIAVLALSQLNRKLEDRGDKRPIMSDLRESGSVEQDADAILMLYRDEVYNPNTSQKGTCEVIIRKNRHGETGTVPTVFRSDLVRFENFAGHWEQPIDQRTSYQRKNRDDL